MAKSGSAIELPWSAWYQDARHTIELPDDWKINVLREPICSAWSADEIDAALDLPVGSPPLSQLAAGQGTVAIAVDDLARPTKAAQILPQLITRLRAAGIFLENISVVVATGAHGTLNTSQLRWKLGDATVDGVRVECHDPSAELADTGIQLGPVPLRINRTFAAADLKVTVGSVLPNVYAGFSGGAKLVLPGLGDLDSIHRCHKFVQMGLRGGADPEINGFRREIEQVARRLGVQFSVCALVNADRDVCGVFAGDIVSAHRIACQRALQIYRTNFETTFDCLVLNAYPKDIDLIQADSCRVALRTLKRPIVRDDGLVVIATAATQGIGRHDLFAPGGRSYRKPPSRNGMGNSELWLYAPCIQEADARNLYGSRVAFHQTRQSLLRALEQRFPIGATAAIVPCAPIQLLENTQHGEF